MDNKLSYLLINILTVFFPIILSFDKKVHYYKKWKFILPGLFITGLLYLLWDYIFTINQVWSFNNDYILGIRFFDLPLEEIMFFITIPFACIFIYECLIAYFKIEISAKIISAISWLLIILCVIMLVLFYDRIYSLVNFSTLLVVLLYTIFAKHHLNMGKFYIAYLVSLLPFYIVNGILTAIPIVMYNDAENMGFRVGTIPFEDHFYSMSLFLMNLLFFEFFRNKKQAA
ncbi:lycopene cyclase domain-containing protein [Pedobacter glucosidilyticus]|uniref:lycopene cyclase domain-containing protein n=1 Tax=Pedobacter glucosidilyticus TaxID=1122941 RepID=UPI0026F0548B|nr:lycopene cyclase domain-containing protein [Pedobacter glucosidilyticus]